MKCSCVEYGTLIFVHKSKIREFASNNMHFMFLLELIVGYQTKMQYNKVHLEPAMLKNAI